MRLKGLASLIGLFFLIAAPSAGAQLPLGEADGVRIFRERRAIVVAQLIDFLSGFRPAPAVKRFARRIVALATPADTPPAGTVGYYSDGGERMAAVFLSRSARRLFIEFEPNDVLRTNVADFIFGDGEP